MKTTIVLALALQFSTVALAQTVSPSAPPVAPQIADVRSGELHLQGYFWKPAGQARSRLSYSIMAPALTTRSIRLVGRWPRPLPILLRSFLNMVTPSFIFAVGAKVFPPTKAHLCKTF